MLDSVLKKIE